MGKWGTVGRLFVATAQARGNYGLPEVEQRPEHCREVAAWYNFPSLPLGLY